MNNAQLAEELACELHAGQYRKQKTQTGERIPYIAHPGKAADAAARIGASDIVVAATWLHDVVEDVPEGDPEERIRALPGGERILAIVLCVSQQRDKSRPWRERMADEIADIGSLPEEAFQVKVCDEWANLDDLRETHAWRGDATFDIFQKKDESLEGCKSRMLWFHISCVEQFNKWLEMHPQAFPQENGLRSLIAECAQIVNQLSNKAENEGLPNSVPLATLLEWEPEIATRVLIPLQAMDRAEIDADPQATYNFFKDSAATLVGDNARNPALRKREYYDTVINEILAIIRQRDA